MDRYVKDLIFRFGRFALAGIVILARMHMAGPVSFVQSAYAGEQPGLIRGSQNLSMPVSGSSWLGVQAAVKVEERAVPEAGDTAVYEPEFLALETALNDLATAQYAPTSDTAYYDLGGIKQRQAEIFISASDCLDRSVYVFNAARELDLNPAIIILHDPLKNSGHSVVEVDDGNSGRMIIDATTPGQPASLRAYTDQGYQVAASVNSLEALTDAMKSIHGEYAVADWLGALGSIVTTVGNTISGIVSSPSPSLASLNPGVPPGPAVSSDPAVSSSPAASSVPAVSSGPAVSRGPLSGSGSRELSILSQFADTVIGEKTGAMKYSSLARVDRSSEKYQISEDTNGTPVIVDASGNPQVVDPGAATIYSAAAKVYHIATGDPRAAAFSASMAEQGMATTLARLAEDLGTNPDNSRNWTGTALAIPVQFARSALAFAEFQIAAADAIVTARRAGWEDGLAKGGPLQGILQSEIEGAKAVWGLGLGLVSFPTDVFVTGPVNFLSSVTGGDGKVLKSNWLAEGVANAPYLKDLGLGEYVGQVDPTKAEYPNIDFTLGNAYFFLKGRISAKKGTSGTVSPEGTQGTYREFGTVEKTENPSATGKKGTTESANAEGVKDTAVTPDKAAGPPDPKAATPQGAQHDAASKTDITEGVAKPSSVSLEIGPVDEGGTRTISIEVKDLTLNGGESKKIPLNVKPDNTRGGRGDVLTTDLQRPDNSKLKSMVEEAKEWQDLPEEEKLQRVSESVRNAFPNNKEHSEENIQTAIDWSDALTGEHGLDVNMEGYGVCRHFSLVFNEVAQAAGLKTVIVQGVQTGFKVDKTTGREVRAWGPHAANEVTLSNGKTLFVDVFNREVYDFKDTLKNGFDENSPLSNGPTMDYRIHEGQSNFNINVRRIPNSDNYALVITPKPGVSTASGNVQAYVWFQGNPL